MGLSHPVWFPELAHEVEIGRRLHRWRLHPDAWGKRFADRGRQAAVDAAPGLGLERLIAVIDPANVRSIAVASRLGMAHERTMPHPQRPGDVFIYARAEPR